MMTIAILPSPEGRGILAQKSDEDNIKLYEIEFINLAEQLEVDKDLLFIMKEKIQKIKKLKIINI